MYLMPFNINIILFNHVLIDVYFLNDINIRLEVGNNYTAFVLVSMAYIDYQEKKNGKKEGRSLC